MYSVRFYATDLKYPHTLRHFQFIFESKWYVCYRWKFSCCARWGSLTLCQWFMRVVASAASWEMDWNMCLWVASPYHWPDILCLLCRWVQEVLQSNPRNMVALEERITNSLNPIPLNMLWAAVANILVHVKNSIVLVGAYMEILS